MYISIFKNYVINKFLGDKLFSFDDYSVDFFLPQLISMYIQMDDIAEAIDPYLVHRYVTNYNYVLLYNVVNIINLIILFDK